MDVTVTPFRAVLDAAQLPELPDCLARSRWPGVEAAGWELGVPESWLRDLVADWARFDVGAFRPGSTLSTTCLSTWTASGCTRCTPRGRGRTRCRWC